MSRRRANIASAAPSTFSASSDQLTAVTEGIGIGAIPSIILGILLFWCPESPRQLMYHGHRDQCERVIRRIYANASEQQVQEKLISIEHGVNAAKSLNEEISLRKSMKMLFTIPANRRAAIAACGLMFFQQFCGK